MTPTKVVYEISREEIERLLAREINTDPRVDGIEIEWDVEVAAPPRLRGVMITVVSGAMLDR